MSYFNGNIGENISRISISGKDSLEAIAVTTLVNVVCRVTTNSCRYSSSIVIVEVGVDVAVVISTVVLLEAVTIIAVNVRHVLLLFLSRAHNSTIILVGVQTSDICIRSPVRTHYALRVTT